MSNWKDRFLQLRSVFAEPLSYEEQELSQTTEKSRKRVAKLPSTDMIKSEIIKVEQQVKIFYENRHKPKPREDECEKKETEALRNIIDFLQKAKKFLISLGKFEEIFSDSEKQIISDHVGENSKKEYRRSKIVDEFFEPQYWINGIIKNFDLEQYIDGDAIERLINNLKIIIDRVDTYEGTREKVLSHEKDYIKNFEFVGFSFHNVAKLDEERLQNTLRHFADAVSKIKNSGFSDVIYGDVYIRPKRKFYGGLYYPSEDFVVITEILDNNYSYWERVIIHELGHRLYYKKINTNSVDYYYNNFFGGYVEKYGSEFWLEFKRKIVLPFVNGSFNFRGKLLDVFSSLPTEVVYNIFEMLSISDNKKKKLMECIESRKNRRNIVINRLSFDDAESFLKKSLNSFMPFSNTYKRTSKAKKMLLESPTEYGYTSFREHFAEVFTCYCMGKPVPENALRVFRETLSQSGIVMQ